MAVALLSMDRMLRHTDVTVSAGLQPSYKTFKQMCPFVYTCGCRGVGWTKITSGGSMG